MTCTASVSREAPGTNSRASVTASSSKPMSSSHGRSSSWRRHPESARAASFRPEIEVEGSPTRVLVEQLGAVDARRLGDLTGRLTAEELWGVDDALRTILSLW